MNAGIPAGHADVPRTVGHYRLERSIGRGGMGEVFLATDTRLPRRVAVKTIHPERLGDERMRRRFVREAEIASSIMHPHVATVLDVLTEDDRVYLVMEYIEGERLNQVIRRDELSLDDRLRIGVEIAEALSAIHGRRLVHRDLKPGNVMISPEGHAKLLDFGLARRADDPAPPAASATATVTIDADTESAPLTAPGAAVGTIAYMSPEQLRGEPLDQRSDIFSLGTLLYEMTTGVHPFARVTSASTVSAILNESPGGESESPTLTGSPDLKRVLDRALAKDPGERYESAAEVAADLEKMRRGEAVTRGAAREARRRRRIAAGVAGAVTVIALLAAITVWFLKRPPVWNEPRFVVSIEPFVNHTGTEDGQRHAELLARLLAVDLETSRLVRVVSPRPASPLLASFVPQTDAGAVDYVLTGALYPEGPRYMATLEAAPNTGRAEIPPLKARGTTATALAEELGAELRRVLPGVPFITALRDDQADVSVVSSASAEAQMLYERGIIAARDAKLAEAVERLEAALALDPEFAAAHVALAEVLDALGYERRARAAADRALQLAPKGRDPASTRLSGIIEATRSRTFGRVDEAVEATRKLVAMYPDEPELLKVHADALRSAGQIDPALEAIDRALVVAPTDASLHVARGRVLIRATRVPEALEALEEARRIYELVGSEGGRAVVLLREGEAYSQLNEFEKASSRFSAAADAFTKSGHESLAIEARMKEAGNYLKQEAPGRALQIFAESEALARKHGSKRLQAEALSRLGGQLYLKNELDEAVEAMQQSVDIARGIENDYLLLDPLQMLGSLLSHTGRVNRAREVLKEVIEVARRLERADRIEMAGLLVADLDYQAGELDAAIVRYEQIRRDNARAEGASFNGTWAAFGLAEIYERQGRLAKALDAASAAARGFESLSRAGSRGSALVRRAQILAALGRDEEAREDLEAARVIAESRSAGFEDLRVRLELGEAVVRAFSASWSRSLAAADGALGLPASETPALAVAAHTAACHALREKRRSSRAIERCRQALAVANAPTSERTLARVELAETLLAETKRDEAVEAAREAMASAAGQGLLLAEARAAAVLVAAGPAVDAAIVNAGRTALRRFIEAAPEPDRGSLSQRSDVLQLMERLDARADAA